MAAPHPFYDVEMNFTSGRMGRWIQRMTSAEQHRLIQHVISNLHIDRLKPTKNLLNKEKKKRAAAARAEPTPPKQRILAFDVEKVQGAKVGNKFTQVAAHVVVVEHVGDDIVVVLNKYVKPHVVTNYLTRYSGMTPIKLANGMSPELLKAELAELFLGAKVICVAAKNDFTSCGLDWRDFDIFDLHTNEDFCHDGDLSRPIGFALL